MTDTDDINKRSYVVKFDGETKNYPKWKVKFSVAAKMSGYWDILSGAKKPPADSVTIDESDAAGKLQAKNRKAHDKAYASLVMAQQSDAALNVVTLAVSTDHPNGDAKIAWDNLNKKYLPKDDASLMVLRNKFLAMKLDNVNTNPTEWIAEVEKQSILMKKAGMTVSETELKLLVLNGMLKEYEATVDVLTAGSKTMTEITTALELKFNLIKTKGPKRGNDMTLNASENCYNGKCNGCGKRGHKEADCWHKKGGNRNQSGQKRFPGKCNYCGIPGHKEAECRKKKRDTEDIVNTASGQTTEDVVLMAYDYNECYDCDLDDDSDDSVDMPSLITHEIDDLSDDKSKIEVEDVLSDDEFEDIDDIDEESQGTIEEAAFMADGPSTVSDKSSKMTNETWLADTGATSHMKMNIVDVIDLEPLSNHTITFGSKDKLKATHRGYYPVLTDDGKTVKLEVVVVPGLWVNLFSITKALTQDWNLSTNTDPKTKVKNLQIQKGAYKIIFNKIISVSDEKQLIGIDFKRPTPVTTNVPGSITIGLIIKHMALHNRLGHPDDRIVHATAAKLGLKVTGKFEICENCALAKIRQTPVSKRRQNQITEPGLCLAFNISSVKNASAGKAMHWLLFINEATDTCFSFFLNTKDELKEHGIALVNDLRGKHNKKVTHMRCDNAGENTDFKNACDELNLAVNFVFTAPGTPQQNGKVKRKFPTLYGCVQAMLNLAGFPERLRHLLWAECVDTATKLENIMVDSADDKSRHEMFYSTEAPYARHLRTFGKMGVTHSHEMVKAKLSNRGVTAIFTGYANDHSGEVHRMYMPSTKCIRLSQDVQWLQKIYKHWNTKSVPHVVRVIGEDIQVETVEDNGPAMPTTPNNPTNNKNDDNDDNTDNTNENDGYETPPPETPPRTQTRPTLSCVERELNRLRTSYNPAEPAEAETTDGDTAMFTTDDSPNTVDAAGKFHKMVLRTMVSSSLLAEP